MAARIRTPRGEFRLVRNDRVGRALREFRLVHQLEVWRFCAIIRCSDKQWYKIETGTQDITLADLQALDRNLRTEGLFVRIACAEWERALRNDDDVA